MHGRHVSGWCASLLAVAFSLAAVSGCSSNEPATEVMLVLAADARAMQLGEGLRVDIAGRSADGQSDGMPISRDFSPKDPNEAQWPLSLAITPRNGDALRTYSVTATLLDVNNAPIAVLRARSGFVAKKTIELRMIFQDDDCLDEASLACAETETCLLGSCVDAFIDATALPPIDTSVSGGWSPSAAADGGVTGSMKPSVMSSPSGTSGSNAKPSGSAGKPGGMQGGAGTSGIEDAGVDAALPVTEGPGECGDGHFNEGEKCDTAIAAGEPGACPTECKATDPCKPEQLEGTGCQTSCVAYPITQIDADDNCCPPGVDAKDDPNCGATCGNRVQEKGEVCDPIETCPTLESCQITKAGACLRPRIEGDAATCNATCVMDTIVECLSGDGCCPDGCTNAMDNDCSASCGNAVLDPGELCEANSTTPCPATCVDMDACTTDMSLGSDKNCSKACAFVLITVPVPGDGCCPAGANGATDLDCPAQCGNGIVEVGERCDGRCPTKADCDDKNPCTSDDVEGSGCTVHCIHTPINAAAAGDSCCPSGANANNDSDCKPVCGNGVKENGEACDGSDCPKCNDNDPCTNDIRGGDKCNPTECRHEPIGPNPQRRDNCCPVGADSSSDRDCTNAPPTMMPPAPKCGDGHVDTGELCDPCPSACEDDGNKCTADKLSGTPCRVTCEHIPITEKARDGCCVAGEDSSTELACTNDPPPTGPVCGDNKVEGDEACDGAASCQTHCNDNDACTDDLFTAAKDACHGTCSHTKKTTPECTQPPAPVCGDGKVDPGETCDGSCPPCTTTDACMRAVPGGTPCNPTCTMEAIPNCCPPGEEQWQNPSCPARCGNNHVETGEQCDETSETCANCTRITVMPTDPVPVPDPPATQ